jgi:hypothetical protein
MCRRAGYEVVRMDDECHKSDSRRFKVSTAALLAEGDHSREREGAGADHQRHEVDSEALYHRHRAAAALRRSPRISGAPNGSACHLSG